MSREQSDARIAFLRRASGPDIPALAFKLAYLIAFKYMNQKTWTAFPSQETLSKDLPADVRTVRRLLAVLQPIGLAIEPGRGRGNVTIYRIEDKCDARGNRDGTWSMQQDGQVLVDLRTCVLRGDSGWKARV